MEDDTLFRRMIERSGSLSEAEQRRRERAYREAVERARRQSNEARCDACGDEFDVQTNVVEIQRPRGVWRALVCPRCYQHYLIDFTTHKGREIVEMLKVMRTLNRQHTGKYRRMVKRFRKEFQKWEAVRHGE